MSRLPGGIFVGVVTLLCGLVFAQFEQGRKSHASAVEQPAASSKQDPVEQQKTPDSPIKSRPKVAAEDRTKS